MRRRQVDYEQLGASYPRHRRADPRIAARIHAELGPAGTVVNVGAGTGSYEPADRWVLAVEPSAAMRAQRPRDAAPAIAARAEALPLDDDAVDAAMACVTIHHWQSPAAGLAELRRVARGPVVVFTFELESLVAWQHDYLREGVTPFLEKLASEGSARPLPTILGYSDAIRATTSRSRTARRGASSMILTSPSGPTRSSP